MSGQGRKPRESKQGLCEAASNRSGVKAWAAEGRERLGEGSRGCGCELLVGVGAVEDALDGGPGVSDGEWRVVCIFHEVADELSWRGVQGGLWSPG